MAKDTHIQAQSFSDRETFAVDLLIHLSDVLQTIIGVEEAEGFIAAVAARMARHVSRQIEESSDGSLSARDETAEALVALKEQIGGHFEIVESTEQRVEFRGCACPFGAKVRGRESLCKVTSGVFGRVAADRLGYARVSVPESIALGHSACKVIVDLGGGPGDGPPEPFSTEYYPLPPEDA